MSKDRLLQILHTEEEDGELDWREVKLLEQYGETIPVELLLLELGNGSSVSAKKLY